MSLSRMFDHIMNLEDKRPPQHGWYPGYYCCLCRNCNSDFIGAKSAWTCADCAYDFDEQLQYEALWRKVGYAYTAHYVWKKTFGNNK